MGSFDNHILDPAQPVVEDFRLIHEEWVGGSRRRIYLNSQHFIRSENYTPAEVNDAVAELCRARRDGDIPQPTRDREHIISVPEGIMNQIWVKNGCNPMQDEETFHDLVVSNADLAAFRCSPDKSVYRKQRR